MATSTIEPRHDLSPDEADWVETRLYEFNRDATGYSDGRGLAFQMRDAEGDVIGSASGYSWGGIAELRLMWVDAAHRGQGVGRRLIEAFIAEASARSVERIFVASFDFQAPRMYEKFGFRRVAALEGLPRGHTSVILCKELK